MDDNQDRDTRAEKADIFFPQFPSTLALSTTRLKRPSRRIVFFFLDFSLAFPEMKNGAKRTPFGSERCSRKQLKRQNGTSMSATYSGSNAALLPEFKSSPLLQ
jgi:hypothetical protein